MSDRAETPVQDARSDSAAYSRLANEALDSGRQSAQLAQAFQPQSIGLPFQAEISIPNNCSTVMKDAARPHSLEQLATTPPDQLACLYHNAREGKIPQGDTQGRAIFMPGSALGDGLSGIANTVWKGKVFDEHGGLVNKILGQHIVKAEVASGTSWLDGRKSTVIDYKNTSLIAGWIRDEIREVSPGLYLGVAYARLPFNNRYPALYFALDTNKPK